MLHKTPKVILPDTLQLLEVLQEDPVFSDFFLVGGTALAMQLGHRLSVDLDFFSQKSFSTQQLVDHLSAEYGDFELTSVSKNTLLGVVKGIKTDFITHAHPLVRELVVEQGLRMASLEDIGAMKLNAIAHSGQRMKDFIDVYFLLEKFPLQAFLDAYSIKYPNSNPLIPLKGLTYFEDIDFQADKPMLNQEVKPAEMKKRLEKAVLNPKLVFK